MQNNSELISIIVPIYNVKKYLRKCLESILSQTYSNIEIILIDDESTDGSGTICDEYAVKDQRIIVVHKEKGGLSSARNVGLDMAKGSLIGFVDSDDYIEPTMYEKLKNNMNKYDSDIAICQFDKRAKYNIKFICGLKEEKVAEGKDKFKYLDYMRLVAWNKLYKKEIFENIRYPEGKIFEDIFVICNVLDKAKRISFVNEVLYHYTMRKSGICRTFSEKHSDAIDSKHLQIDYFKKHNYLDLQVNAEYKEVMEIIGYARKLNVKNL